MFANKVCGQCPPRVSECLVQTVFANSTLGGLSEANAWAKEYPAWPLPGMPVSQIPSKPKRNRWADGEPLDADAAERVARALAVNCATLERRIAEITEAGMHPVQPEDEQPRVQDEQTWLEQHAAEYWDAITSEPLSTDLTRAARQEELGFMNGWKVWDVVPVSQSWDRTGKAPLKGRWWM